MTTDKKPIATVSLETQLIRKRLDSCEVGDIVTYTELADITKRSVEEFRPAFQTAARQLLTERGWLFGAVRTVGYKRLDSAEKMDAADAKRKHISKTARKAMKVMASIEVEGLPDTDKRRHYALASGLGAIALATSNKSMRAIEEKATTAALPPKETLRLFA